MLLASRNLSDGLINEHQFAAIEETNSVLDIHKRGILYLYSGSTSYRLPQLPEP
jgi:flagellar biosynthesis/type III secretory pathway chaperone